MQEMTITQGSQLFRIQTNFTSIYKKDVTGHRHLALPPPPFVKVTFSNLVLETSYRDPGGLPFMPHPIEDMKFRQAEGTGAVMKLRNHTGRFLKVSKRSQKEIFSISKRGQRCM